MLLKLGLQMTLLQLDHCRLYQPGGSRQHLSSVGPDYGYFTNATKTVLIVKPEHLSSAQTMFANTNIRITTHGQQHLGAALGSREFGEEYVTTKVESWTAEVSALAEIATSRPHAAYCAFTHGLIGRWVYLMRTVPGISNLLRSSKL